MKAKLKEIDNKLLQGGYTNITYIHSAEFAQEIQSVPIDAASIDDESIALINSIYYKIPPNSSCDHPKNLVATVKETMEQAKINKIPKSIPPAYLTSGNLSQLLIFLQTDIEADIEGHFFINTPIFDSILDYLINQINRLENQAQVDIELFNTMLILEEAFQKKLKTVFHDQNLIQAKVHKLHQLTNVIREIYFKKPTIERVESPKMIPVYNEIMDKKYRDLLPGFAFIHQSIFHNRMKQLFDSRTHADATKKTASLFAFFNSTGFLYTQQTRADSDRWAALNTQFLNYVSAYVLDHPDNFIAIDTLYFAIQNDPIFKAPVTMHYQFGQAITTAFDLQVNPYTQAIITPLLANINKIFIAIEQLNSENSLLTEQLSILNQAILNLKNFIALDEMLNLFLMHELNKHATKLYQWLAMPLQERSTTTTMSSSSKDTEENDSSAAINNSSNHQELSTFIQQSILLKKTVKAKETNTSFILHCIVGGIGTLAILAGIALLLSTSCHVIAAALLLKTVASSTLVAAGTPTLLTGTATTITASMAYKHKLFKTTENLKKDISTSSIIPSKK